MTFIPDSRLPLPAIDRVPSRETQFLNEYVQEYEKNTEEVYSAYADTVYLMKKVKVPYRDQSTTGVSPNGPRGRYGSRRVTQASEYVPPASSDFLRNNAPARPEGDPDPQRIKLPCVVEINPNTERRLMFGLEEEDTGIIHFARRWLDNRGVVIDVAEDYIEHRTQQYRLSNNNFRGNFLNGWADLSFNIARL